MSTFCGMRVVNVVISLELGLERGNVDEVIQDIF